MWFCQHLKIIKKIVPMYLNIDILMLLDEQLISNLVFVCSTTLWLIDFYKIVGVWFDYTNLFKYLLKWGIRYTICVAGVVYYIRIQISQKEFLFYTPYQYTT